MLIMLNKIQSGLQRGADIAGVDAAISLGFPYGGWVPKGRRTEAGPLEPKYSVTEMPTTGYPPRTKQNIIDSNGTVIFTHGALSGGSSLTKRLADEQKKPWLHIDLNKYSIDAAVNALSRWINSNGIEVLNVAGKSASKDPYIYDKVFQIISVVIKESNVK
jgi:hypothetical protein